MLHIHTVNKLWIPHLTVAPCLRLQEAPKRARWTLGGTRKVGGSKQQQQKQQPRGRLAPKPKQVRSYVACLVCQLSADAVGTARLRWRKACTSVCSACRQHSCMHLFAAAAMPWQQNCASFALEQAVPRGSRRGNKEEPPKKKGFLESLGFNQETVYADEG